MLIKKNTEKESKRNENKAKNCIFKITKRPQTAAAEPASKQMLVNVVSHLF